ncbi:hypothetical protein [Embleya sp. NPDC059237]|uniref:hypothetical protein n=1 Tax=Embleya sp. NPDC059237 TaxID=3346784 RepID=UPI0036BEE2CA
MSLLPPNRAAFGFRMSGAAAAVALLLAGCSDAKAERPPNGSPLYPCDLLTDKEQADLELQVLDRGADGPNAPWCLFGTRNILGPTGRTIAQVRLAVWDSTDPNDPANAKSQADAAQRDKNADVTVTTVNSREIYQVRTPRSADTILYFPVNPTSSVSAAVSAPEGYSLSQLTRWIEAKLPAPARSTAADR